MRRGAIAAARGDDDWSAPGQTAVAAQQLRSPIAAAGVNQSIGDVTIGAPQTKDKAARTAKRSAVARESKVRTPETEKVLNESMFGKKNDEIFNRLKKLWAK